MDHEVRQAIAFGVPPLVAYQMATINNARHWRVDTDHGILAPGRYADALLISDLEKVRIEKVVASGQLVAEPGANAGTISPHLRFQTMPATG